MYTAENILRSSSGFEMPFVQDGDNVYPTLMYGDQKHPSTGARFFHHGLDFGVRLTPLLAVATGTVSSIATDADRGVTLRVRYGCYEVSYCHLSNVYANFGEEVKAGQTVALSGNMLHMSVTCDGEEIDPMEFLEMLNANIEVIAGNGVAQEGFEFVPPSGSRIPDYDMDEEGIERLFVRYLPAYLADIQTGRYTVPERTELSLRTVLQKASDKRYYYERIPALSNPLGVGPRAVPLANKVQNLIIEDFLNYLTQRQGVNLSSSAPEKKKSPSPAWRDRDRF